MQPLLTRALESGRVHSAYLLSGTGPAPRDEALCFARALVCAAGAVAERPCESCSECQRSHSDEPIAIDGTGKKGPLFRHVGDHADLFWVERGPDDTRVRIGQVRAVQGALRMGAHEGGWRVAVVADAEWLNVEAQNALLRLLEEPPPQTCLLIVTTHAAGLLATLRSRCQRVVFPREREDLLGEDAPDDVREVVERLEILARAGLPDLLDWAEEYRGDRASAAARVQTLLATGSAWLHRRVTEAARQGRHDLRPGLEAFRRLGECRKDLAQRNANPQMVAERALFTLRESLS